MRKGVKNITELYRLSEAVKRSGGYQRAKNTVDADIVLDEIRQLFIDRSNNNHGDNDYYNYEIEKLTREIEPFITHWNVDTTPPRTWSEWYSSRGKHGGKHGRTAGVVRKSVRVRRTAQVARKIARSKSRKSVRSKSVRRKN